MAVYSTDELERLLGTTLGAEDIATLREIETDAVETVEEITNRRLGASASITEIRSGNGQRILPLYNDTTTANVTSVEIRDGSSWSTVTSTQYAVYDDNKLTSFGINWPYGEWNIRIVYTAGYNDAQQIPRDLRRAVGEITLGRYVAHRKSEDYEIPADVMRSLQRWTVKNFKPQPRLVLGA